MRLLAFHIDGLRLYENGGITLNLHTTDAVRTPGFTHPLDGAARNISVSTVIGIAGINASGKTTLLRVIELALGVAGGLSLGTLNQDLFPLLDTMGGRLTVRAAFEHDGKFHLIESELDVTGDPRTPLRYARETLRLNHGKMSRKRISDAVCGTPDERWTMESTRNIGRSGRGGELSDDAKRYLSPDRSIAGAVSGGVDVTADLLPVMPMLSVNPATPVIQLFDDRIESLSSDKDGIHLRFKGEDTDRDMSPSSLISVISAGTLRGGALLTRVMESLRHGGYLLVDELENSINKQLVFAIMDLFASPVTNPHGASLIFTTHYPELLDHFTRKDGIWFTVRRDGGFRVENLGDHLGRTGLKKSVSFMANRVKGTAPSYQAIRRLHDYAEEYANAR